MARRRYTPRLKAQVVLEVLSGGKTPGQVAKAYGVHPNSVQLWSGRRRSSPGTRR
ncbi:transposase [Candidatus Palauibacter sp.]|uniref:transposase n=1 Tax=Candidatus Palauibacter sp. TaxID=3101350 RepID=UPI003CC67291